MSSFLKWLDRIPKSPEDATDKTDRTSEVSGSVSFVSATSGENKNTRAAETLSAQVTQPTDAMIPALPEKLARLVRAAAGGHLSYPTGLLSPMPGGSGHISDLGDFVLAWAATYAIGGDSEHALARLQAAYGAWVS